MSVLESKIWNLNNESRMYTGLSSKEAEHKLERCGPNTLTAKKKISAIKILFDQFTDFMVLVLLASTAISMFMGEITEAVTIIAIVIINAILGFIQEYRTEQTMEALKGLAAPTARVIRDSRLETVPAENIVPGDLIVLEAGDRVPADALLVEVNSLSVDEALLTGESLPVEKSLESGKKTSAGAAKKNTVYMGTIVTNGRGKAVVCGTGMSTEMGKIADMIQNIEEEETPLQKKLEHLGKFIVYGCLVICAIVSVTGVLRGEQIFTMLLAGISLAVAAIPEGLPAIVTIALALGVQRMLKRNALIRKLPAVETLGCASVICTDKTGTLTENKMTVRKVYAGDCMVDISGNGYSPEGSFFVEGKGIDPGRVPALKLTLEIGAVCNNAKMTKPEQTSGGAVKKLKSLFGKQEHWGINGDPTEGALLVVAAKSGFTEEAASNTYNRIDELPFDSDRKCMSVISKNRKGETLVFTKGAPDIIINKCSKIFTASGIIELTPTMRKNILRANDGMAGAALRVLGVAYKNIGFSAFNKKEAECELVFAGLLGMIDPPRKEAIEAVQKCRLAGIKPVMITGDHKITATAIAKELNIYNQGDRVLTGDELERMTEADLERVAEEVAVYARVSPKHKLMIVKTLKRLGHIVAMTGDGVNDAPAIKEADIGVSMGITGTDVTKEASSMVLMDDNFATIIAAIEEGRVIYNNIRKFIRYLLSCNLGEVLTMFLGMLLGLPLPLLPIHILLVNLVTDGLPAMALGLDPADNDIMKRPPRGAKENIFSNGLMNLILFRGTFIGVSTLAVFTSVMHFTGNLATARTGALVTLVSTQLLHVFECKSERKTLFEINPFNNPALVLAVLCSAATILAVVYYPVLQSVFKTVPLGLTEWSLILGFSAMGPLLSSFFKPNAKYRI